MTCYRKSREVRDRITDEFESGEYLCNEPVPMLVAEVCSKP